MKNLLSLCALLLATAPSMLAQDSLAIRYGQTITQQDLKKHLYEIASDEYEGRETGYEGQRMCERYLVNHYKTIGLPAIDGSYVQTFEVSVDDPSRVYVKQGEREFTFLEDYYYYPATRDRSLSGELYYTGYGVADSRYTDINIMQVKDKVVMVWAGEPSNSDGTYTLTKSLEPSAWTIDREKKATLMAENGARAMFVIHEDYHARKQQVSGYFSHSGMSLKSEEQVQHGPAVMPVFHISPEMATALLGKKAMNKAKKQLIKKKVSPITGATVSMRFDRSSEILETTNVMGYIEGSDLKDEVVVLTAHYDHIGVEGEVVYNGADDDGTGTVALMEIAEAFAQAKADGHGPRRSVLVINVSGEEKGLLGSQYYSEHPVFPLENTVADLNIDMIGRVDEAHEGPGKERYVYLIGADRISQDLHDVGEEVNAMYTKLDLDYTFNAEDEPNRFYYRSDHYNFAKNGVPSVFFFSGVHEDYHQPGDTVDKIMFEKFTEITQLVYYTAWEIANRDERLRITVK